MQRVLAVLAALGATGTIYDNWGELTAHAVLFSLFCAWGSITLWKGRNDENTEPDTEVPDESPHR